ncbi:uncharacterized protein LOC111256927 [Setaria italica]|nr:uncharacterized protein LOC111256927 [Setaria italica]
MAQSRDVAFHLLRRPSRELAAGNRRGFHCAPAATTPPQALLEAQAAAAGLQLQRLRSSSHPTRSPTFAEKRAVPAQFDMLPLPPSPGRRTLFLTSTRSRRGSTTQLHHNMLPRFLILGATAPAPVLSTSPSIPGTIHPQVGEQLQAQTYSLSPLLAKDSTKYAVPNTVTCTLEMNS